MNTEYEIFLDSPEWKFFSADYRTRHPKCVLCGRNEDLNVHHVRYTDDLFDEQHLVTLCSSCHSCFHRGLEQYGELYSKRHILLYSDVLQLLTEITVDFYCNSFCGNNGFNIMEHRNFEKFKNFIACGFDARKKRLIFKSDRLTCELADVCFENRAKNEIGRIRAERIRRALEHGVPAYILRQQHGLSEASFRRILDRIGADADA